MAGALRLAPRLRAALTSLHQRLAISERGWVGGIGAAAEIDHAVDAASGIWIVEQPCITSAGFGALLGIAHEAGTGRRVADGEIEPVAHAHTQSAIAAVVGRGLVV